MAKVFNRAAHKTATATTGDLTLGAALASTDNLNVCAWDSFSGAGVANNDVVAYLILDSNGNFEYGTATYLSAGPTLSARTVERSSIGGVLGTSLITTTGSNTQVIITARRKDLHYVPQALTDLATTAWDMKDGQIATWTLGGNRTLSAPTNRRPGEVYLIVTQDATGGRTITWNAVFKWPNDVPPKLKTTATTGVDVFRFVDDGTNLYGTHVNKVPAFGDTLVMAGTTTLTATDDQKLVTNSGANRTVNLPAPVKGFLFAFYTTGGTLLVDTPGAETINGPNGAVANITMRADTFLVLECDGTNWIVIADSNYNRRGHQTLTVGATINWDANLGRSAQVTLNQAGHTMANPTNLIEGEIYDLHLIQDATGSRTITTWGTSYKFASGVKPTLTTTAGATDICSFICRGGVLWGNWGNNYS
jgi:hypothetical protein